MDNNKLREFLATGACQEINAEANDAAISIVIKDEDVFLQLLANLCAVEMLAKDFHYRAKGKAFYGEHLLADLIHDIGEKSDDINEIHYMGELQSVPPFRADVAREAVRIIDGLPQWVNENGLIEALFDRTNALVGLVEQAKTKNPLSGTTAILDAVSEKALQVNGFLKRMLSGDEMSDNLVDAENSAE